MARDSFATAYLELAPGVQSRYTNSLTHARDMVSFVFGIGKQPNNRPASIATRRNNTQFIITVLD
jgi:hypothetical protein